MALVVWLFAVLLLMVLLRDAACLLRWRCEVTDFPLRLVDRFFARSLWAGLKRGTTSYALCRMHSLHDVLAYLLALLLTEWLSTAV